jgi:hypothetical protein
LLLWMILANGVTAFMAFGGAACAAAVIVKEHLEEHVVRVSPEGENKEP